MKKQYKYPPLGLFVEEVYVTRVNGEKGSSFSNPVFEINDIKLTNDFSKARRIHNREIQKHLEAKGFQSIEVLGKLKSGSANPSELMDESYKATPWEMSSEDIVKTINESKEYGGVGTKIDLEGAIFYPTDDVYR